MFLAASGTVAILIAVGGGFRRVVPALVGVVLWAAVATHWYRAGRRPPADTEAYGTQPRRGVERWGPPAVAVLVFGTLFWQGIVPKIRSLGADGAVLTWEVPLDGTDGRSVELALVGELDVPDALQLVAMCRNGTDWMSDTTLNLEVLVATTPVLIRAAELVMTGAFDAGLVRDVEQRAIVGLPTHEIVAELEAGSAREIERYMAARAVLPSEDAVGRYVAYVPTVNGFGDGLLRVVDRNDLDDGAIRAFAGSLIDGGVRVAGSGQAERRVAASACRDLVER